MGDFAVDYRECPLAAVDTAYALTQRGANTPGAFIVPKGAQLITAIKIFVSGIAADVVTGSVFGVHLIGLPGIQWWVGPLMSLAAVAGTSGGYQFADAMVYQTRIPVGGLSQFEAECFVNGEDAGTVHLLLQIEYDGVPGRIVDADYREDDIGAAANTLTALTHRGAAVDQGNFKTNGKSIVEIIFGAALDPTGDAANGLVFAPALHLDGNGLVTNNKPLYLLGPAGPTQPDTDASGNQNCIVNPSRVTPGNGLRTQTGEVEALSQNIESINPGHAIVGLCYG